MKIAYGDSRKAKIWKNSEVSWEDFCARLSTTQRTTETIEEFLKMKKSDQDSIKDVGGYVLGHLKNGSRKAGMVLSRSAIALDMDYGEPGIVETIHMLFGVRFAAYGTHKYTPENPRLRIIFPLSRDVTEEEYPAAARMIASQIGMDLFDDSTYEPNRMMYWPSTPSNVDYFYKEYDGELLNPDEYLAQYDDWRDISTWPVSTRQSQVIARSTKKQADPLGKPGIVGVFCRTYTIRDAIETFLSDVYVPSDVEGRYDYIAGESSAGVQIFDKEFAYSHHATDPACGQLCNAFDLVRIHKFPDESDKKSFQAMAEFAVSQDEVKIELSKEKAAEADLDFGEGDDWRRGLKYKARSNDLEDSVPNLLLILTHDPDFQNIGYNQMANMVQITGPVPWDRKGFNDYWRDSDTAQMKAFLDSHYVQFSTRNFDVAFQTVTTDRKFHPIRDYLDNLPEWDGTVRVPGLLVKYMKADDTAYVHTVTKKTFTAAVARIYEPGIKFDCMLVLDGDQGIGKSTFFRELVGDQYFSDSLQLTDMQDKSGAEKLQGTWVMEIAELAGMKKADIEKVKSFLSTPDDKYRPSYGHTVESHPRQSILVGSVNGERGYLRDITGNRRFWIVKLHQSEQVKKFNFTPEERDQIWAEAKHYYQAGEKLYLEGSMLSEAEAAQKSAMEVDERQGIVEEYLRMLLPENWAAMDVFQRKQYFQEKDDPTRPKGTVQRDFVSNAEIWCECYGKNFADMKPADSYAIAALMEQVPGWERTKDRKTIPMYGRQRLYKRTGS